MPDLVGDPRLANVNQPVGPNPLHDDDPSNDDQAEAWLANANLWREWAARQDEAIAKLVQQGASAGQTAEQTLGKAGFKNAKEQGMHAYTMYGTGGYYSQQGAAADPGWRYDWATGLKYNQGTDDLSARTRGVPINSNEYAERAKAQNYASQGINDYGMQANSEAFKRALKSGHFNLDPKTGNYFSGAGPDDPGNNWVDKYGRAINGRGGAPTGQSFNGSSLYGGAGGYGGGGGGYGDMGGGYGASGFGGGGFGGGFSPGAEASGFAQADLNSAMAEGMRNDILSQQIQLQKNLEGHAQGSAIYDYLQNQVYGPILGVQFQGNKQGVSQYSNSVNPGSASEYDVQYSSTPGQQPISQYQAQKAGENPWEQGEYDPNTGWFTGQQTSSPEEPIDGYMQQKYGDQGQMHIMGAPEGGDPGFDTSNIQTMGSGPLASVIAGVQRGGKGSGTQVGQVDENGEAVGIANAVGNAAAAGDPDAIAGMNVPLTEDQIQKRQSAFEYMQQQGMITPEEAQKRMQTLQTQQAQIRMKAGQRVQALGTPLPTGSYTQTGTDAFDPNMNQSWARFIAPTMNQQMKMGDDQMEQIRRQMPRGGSQDRAISDSINQRYGAMQQGWQSLVPTALQGISDIGKEMYFQQPAANSGAMGTAGSLAQSQQQYNLGLKQIASNEKVADTQAGAAKWGAVGSALGGLSSLISPIKLSDERAKKDVSSFSEDLDDVSQMEPKSYKYNGKMGSKNNEPGVSLMAQDAKKVDKKIAGKMPNGAMGVKPMEILMKTVNSVKALEQRVSQLTGGR